MPTNCRKIFGFTLAESATHVDTPPCKVKFGFTLAEILITLGIIGVVAAMTIPNLIANNKAHRLKSQFLESYSIVQQVFKQMEADDVSLDPKDYPTGQFYKTFMKYVQAPTDCSRKRMSVCYYFVDDGKNDEHSKPYKTLDGNANVAGNWFDDGQIALQNGSLILFENYTDIDQLWVSVDLNGYNNPPNRWGVDLFTFQFIEGELVTMGDQKSKYNNIESYCNPKTSNTLNGIACAQKAKTESDYFNWVVKNVK